MVEVSMIIASAMNLSRGTSLTRSLSCSNGTYLLFSPSLLCTIALRVLYIRLDNRVVAMKEILAIL